MICALRAGPCGPVALQNAPAGADPAAPIFFRRIFIKFGGRKRPPYRAEETGNRLRTPRNRTPLPGGIYASPTNTRYRVHNPKNVVAGQTATGCNHAAPTNLPGRQVNGQSKSLPQTVHGGVKNTAPTMRGKQQVNHVRAAGRRPRRGLRPQTRFGGQPPRSGGS